MRRAAAAIREPMAWIGHVTRPIVPSVESRVSK
jgi:hypothetical protein